MTNGEMVKYLLLDVLICGTIFFGIIGLLVYFCAWIIRNTG